jgi:hypothetical protein
VVVSPLVRGEGGGLGGCRPLPIWSQIKHICVSHTYFSVASMSSAHWRWGLVLVDLQDAGIPAAEWYWVRRGVVRIGVSFAPDVFPFS